MICSMEMLLVLGLITNRKWPRPSIAIAPPCKVSAYGAPATPDSVPFAAFFAYADTCDVAVVTGTDP